MNLLLEHKRAPGDVLMMTCAVRDLHRAQPDRHRVQVSTNVMGIWDHNPHTLTLRNGTNRHFRLSYGLSVKSSNQRNAHFASAFNQHLSECLGFRVPLTDLRGDIHLSDREKDPAHRRVKEPYWVIAPGGKSDFTAKIWDRKAWQATVESLTAEGRTVVQAGSKSNAQWMARKKGRLSNFSPTLKGVKSFVGKTDVRELFSLIYHSEGVISLVSFPMHIAAALNKPCVVLAGGREPWWWEGYTRTTWELNCTAPCPEDFVEHRYLHTLGKLPCCDGWGCWKDGVGDKANSNCKAVVQGQSQAQPKCMTLITPAMVTQAVKDYEAGLPVVNEEIPARLLPGLCTEPIRKQKPPVATRKNPGPVMKPRVKYTHRTPNNPNAPRGAARTIRPARRAQVVARPVRRNVVQPARRTRVSPAPTTRDPKIIQRMAGKKPRQKPRAPIAAPRKLPPPVKTPVRVKAPSGGAEAARVPFTVCVLVYGDYLDIIKRCLASVRDNLSPEFARFRVGMNAVTPRVRQWVADNMPEDRTTVFDSEENIFKYPLMRKMFNEPAIDTEWVMWFDDDSHIVDSAFQRKLQRFLAGGDYDYVGKPYIYTWLTSGQAEWVKEATWYKGKAPLRKTSKGQSRMTVDFATGGFWCIKTEVIRTLDWPDPRIGHNFGDVSLGEAIRQNDFRFGKFHEGITISDHPRRGASQRHPGR